MQLTLVVIHGVPGAGKSTLMPKLRRDLNLPAIGKDQIKENLYDTVGTGDLRWKEMLGRASIRMLYHVADEVLALEQSLIIENAFFKEFAAQELADLAHKHQARIIEVYCKLAVAMAKKRFIERQESGQRHPGHQDNLHAQIINNPAFWRRYDPLDIGTRLDFDTSKPDEVAYQRLLITLRNILQEAKHAPATN
ncbi:MAG TPA: AAA family ATPase [Candidatus Saccharimonadales bacterium]|nr:AAA family ATPase [Candidatus Saccharimonadales bacterium]